MVLQNLWTVYEYVRRHRTYACHLVTDTYTTFSFFPSHQAVELLRPGRILIYSTCTITLEENEGMVHWALTRFPCLRLAKQVRCYLHWAAKSQDWVMIHVNLCLWLVTVWRHASRYLEHRSKVQVVEFILCDSFTLIYSPGSTHWWPRLVRYWSIWGSQTTTAEIWSISSRGGEIECGHRYHWLLHCKIWESGQHPSLWSRRHVIMFCWKQTDLQNQYRWNEHIVSYTIW